MPEIKICGINDASFALEAARLGVDYLGFIFEPSSPRCVDVAIAAGIASELRATSGKRRPRRFEESAQGASRPFEAARAPLPRETQMGERASRPFEAARAPLPREFQLGEKPRLVGVFVRQTPSEILDIMDRAGLDVVQLHRRATPEDVAALRASGREIWTLAGGAPGDGVLFDSSHGDGESAFRRGAYKSILAGRLSAANAAEAIATGADVLDFNSSLEVSPGRKSVSLLSALFEVLHNLL